MDYEVKGKFKIFILADTHAPAFNGRVCGLQSTHKEFDNHAEAVDWRQDKGERHTDYTILEVMRNP